MLAIKCGGCLGRACRVVNSAIISLHSIMSRPRLFPGIDGTAEQVDLMGDQDEFASFDLGMADADPARKPVEIQAGMALQGVRDQVDNEMEEIGLVPGIAAAPREDHP